ALLRFARLPAAEGGPNALDDAEPVRLILRPDVESRSFHEKTKAFAGPERDFPAAVRPAPSAFLVSPPGRTPLAVRLAPDDERESQVASPKSQARKNLSQAPIAARGLRPATCDLRPATDLRFVAEPEWHYMVPNPVEAERGQDGSDDLFSPGWFGASLPGGAAVVLDASVPGEPGTEASCPKSQVTGRKTQDARRKTQDADPACDLRPATCDSLRASLSSAFRAFLAKREDAPTVIAGYPWFLDWGRDTFIALRGAVADGMSAAALDVLRKFGAFEDRGTLPNMIHGADASNRDTSDAPLWYCVVVGDLLGKSQVASRKSQDERRKTKDGRRMSGPRPATCDVGEADLRPLFPIVLRILHGYLSGTPNGIRVDPASGLVFSPPHFTWMDTNFPAGTPREGYPVEIQALWLRALALAAKLEPKGPWAALREKASASFLRFFWSPERGFLSDCLHAPGGYRPAAQAEADDHLRCNQLFAVTLGAVPPDHPAARAVVASSERLLVPGAIRTLAPGRVRYELPIDGPGGRLNDPAHPYWGRYEGDEDTRRKPAYHNGTAWPWPFPSYAEALVLVYGDSAREAAASLLSTALPLLEADCVGHLPEIMDGDAPHTGRGCDAQAWSASEFLRVAALLGL
ncbi:MAG: glycogen debranching enzyme N-terminal domain-containing protein, partial [Kiritimatiellae bacterium]|nr:glycogen debranching enzyme N-terminal domain-containing protein [Kiritimatiellia bacterium]